MKTVARLYTVKLLQAELRRGLLPLVGFVVTVVWVKTAYASYDTEMHVRKAPGKKVDKSKESKRQALKNLLSNPVPTAVSSAAWTAKFSQRAHALQQHQ